LSDDGVVVVVLHVVVQQHVVQVQVIHQIEDARVKVMGLCLDKGLLFVVLLKGREEL
jgi:hypothetical protein